MLLHYCASAGPHAGVNSLGAASTWRMLELKQWLNVTETMVTGLDPKTGSLRAVLAGYFALEDIALANYARRSVPMDVVLGRERIQKTQVD